MTSRYLLYVARDKKNSKQHDIGSVLCMQALEFVPQQVVEMQECHSQTRGNPEWLIGTPTLFELDSGRVFRGHHALTHIQRISVEHATHQTTSKQAKKPAYATPPPPQLQPSESGDRFSGGEDTGDNDMAEMLWESQVHEEEAEDEEEGDPFSRKLTSDDLSRAVNARTTAPSSAPQSGGSEVALPPALKD